jgi:RimJ/RimL family protein N-acetyltransferase
VVGQIAATGLDTPRLRCTPLGADDLATFHALVVDEHIRRYLLDGEVLPPAWSAERIADSRASFANCGVGLWIARDRKTGEAIGFCGFLELGEPGVEQQLVYAVLESRTGQGLATEMAAACIARARAAGFNSVSAGVDAVNVASVRLLERLGFVRETLGQGTFGDLWTYRLTLRC